LDKNLNGSRWTPFLRFQMRWYPVVLPVSPLLQAGFFINVTSSP
jgi:hypothetical protein